MAPSPTQALPSSSATIASPTTDGSDTWLSSGFNVGIIILLICILIILVIVLCLQCRLCTVPVNSWRHVKTIPQFHQRLLLRRCQCPPHCLLTIHHRLQYHFRLFQPLFSTTARPVTRK
ncbi:hypothetical protein niasHT_027816 [Heterodera trifolii]|uniref:Uncharacterized protein n=1 Tax=Heterodera trifolii TaxID=157864 RepID=A0ABD2JSB0_9BILA